MTDTPTEEQVELVAKAINDNVYCEELPWTCQYEGIKENCRRAARAAITWMPSPTVGEWQPIETAPKDGPEFNAYREDQGVFTCRYAHMEEFMDPDLYSGDDELGSADHEGFWHEMWGWLDDDLKPTHWMPLPSPPQTPQEGE